MENNKEKVRGDCPKCGRKDVPILVELKECGDGAHSDEKYTCMKCEAIWWADGIDS